MYSIYIIYPYSKVYNLVPPQISRGGLRELRLVYLVSPIALHVAHHWAQRPCMKWNCLRLLKISTLRPFGLRSATSGK